LRSRADYLGTSPKRIRVFVTPVIESAHGVDPFDEVPDTHEADDGEEIMHANQVRRGAAKLKGKYGGSVRKSYHYQESQIGKQRRAFWYITLRRHGASFASPARHLSFGLGRAKKAQPGSGRLMKAFCAKLSEPVYRFGPWKATLRADPPPPIL
jgi:hypothetical protein